MKCLNVFAKAPVEGSVKTRLCPPLSLESAAKLADAFLRDALAQYARLGVNVRLYLAGEWDADSSTLCGAKLFRQGNGTLGQRLQAACQEASDDGYDQIVVIGSDHPTLPFEYIEKAFLRIQNQNTAVIGPTSDGGFYLLGMNRYAPHAFEGTFSHAGVLSETHARMIEIWDPVYELPEWYDIDRGADLERLVQDLRSQIMRDACPMTCQVLEDISWM